MVNVRMTPEQVKRVDELVDRGVSVSRTEFVKEAIQFKVYVEEHRVAEFTLTSKGPIRSQDDRNTS